MRYTNPRLLYFAYFTYWHKNWGKSIISLAEVINKIVVRPRPLCQLPCQRGRQGERKNVQLRIVCLCKLFVVIIRCMLVGLLRLQSCDRCMASEADLAASRLPTDTGPTLYSTVYDRSAAYIAISSRVGIPSQPLRATIWRKIFRQAVLELWSVVHVEFHRVNNKKPIKTHKYTERLKLDTS